MNNAQWFQVANTVAMLSWIALVVQPRRVASRLRFIIPGALALLYLWAIATSLPESDGGFDSLEHVKLLFANDRALLAGWVHYLAFDLFIGCWEVIDAQKRGVRHLFVIPCLVLTFMLGPVGLLLYFGVRQLAAREAFAEPAFAPL